MDDDAFNWNLEHINENRNEIRTHHLFHKPAYFKLRVTLLLILVALSLSSAAIMILYFPVHVGRRILETLVGHDRKIHEMYTVRTVTVSMQICDIYFCSYFWDCLYVGCRCSPLPLCHAGHQWAGEL